MVSSLGVYDPVLALKSPQIMVVSWGWVWSIMSSMSAVAWASVMARHFKDGAGGRYMLIKLMR
jgi:hypothetical protein